MTGGGTVGTGDVTKGSTVDKSHEKAFVERRGTVGRNDGRLAKKV